jgi:hypothetical protein
VEGGRSLEDLPSHIEVTAHDLEHRAVKVYVQFAGYLFRSGRSLYFLLNLSDAPAIPGLDQ